MKTLFKEDIKTGNTLQNTLQTIDITVKKYLYCLAKCFRLGSKSPTLFTKKKLFAEAIFWSSVKLS